MVSFTREDFRQCADSSTFEKIVNIETVPELLAHVKKNYLGKPAIGKADGSTATYDEFLSDILKVCSKLEKLGVKKGVNVGVLCQNSYEFAVMAIGTMAYGAVSVLLPVQLDAGTVFGCTAKYRLAGILYADGLEEKLTVMKEKLPAFAVSTGEVLAGNADGKIAYDIKPDDSAAIIMTGGTTGRSKGAILSHTALMCGMINGCYGLREVFGMVYYCLIPLTHVFGFIRNLLTSIYTGSTIYFNTDKRKMFDELKAYKPTELVVVPALAELFLNLIKGYGIDFVGGNIKVIICGAASVPPYLINEYSKLGITFCPGYGLTEFANMVSGNPEGTECPESVGYLFPDQEAKLVDGELWLRGRNMMKEYYAEDEENKNAFEDGWFKTGDLARFDKQGRLYIIGRIKDVIVLPNGENVSPAYIESKINELPFIQDSLVTEDKNELGVTILKLEVVLRAPVVKAMGIPEDGVYDYVKNAVNKVCGQLQDYERVSKIVIRQTDFERSPSMKIIRPKRLY